MGQYAILEITTFVFVVLILVKPLGAYMAAVFEQKPCKFDKVIAPCEHLFYKLCGIQAQEEMNWKQYLISFLAFTLMAFVFLLLILLNQKWMPLNPEGFNNIPFIEAVNIALSFVTNTNWQNYAGESSLSYFTQMAGLTVHNFISAATGLAILLALIRGFTRKETDQLGNFWVDLTRAVLYVFLPLAVIWALILMSQGVIQNFKPYLTAHILDAANTVNTQTLPMGPVASQEAIKDLGSNGGGFFQVNSAHPFENPNPCSNFFEMLGLILIPASLCYMFGQMVRDVRQGWAILTAMTLIFLVAIFVLDMVEQQPNPLWQNLPVNMQVISDGGLAAPGGNMEGKELRFGIDDSVLFSVATTATSNGSVNSMLDSYTPVGSMIPLFLIQLGEVVYGGVGSGLYNMLIMVIITVFIAGLMVGRTPEYLGKKIEPFEMKMAALIILLMPVLVLIPTAISVLDKNTVAGLGNLGAHGFSEILYAFSSMANNNGSSFSSLSLNTDFFNILGGLIMLLGRVGIIVPVLAIAGSLAAKKSVPVGLGTLPTHTGFFIGMLIFVIFIIAGLTFIPALVLGPITEELQWYHL